jgi:hypothetical protein
LVSRETAAGTEPLRVLLKRLSEVRDCRLLILAGIVPERKLSLRSKLVSFVSCKRAFGMLPVSALLGRFL